jgi:undecaprenyl-diphosphatase
MNLFDAAILGLIQGITEFLPVSSTGHLVLAHSVLHVTGSGALAFDAMLHFATALAVIVYFYDEIWVLLQTILRKLGRLPVNQKDLTLLYALIIGTIPAVVLGLFLESYMETTFRSPLIVAAVLFIGALFFVYAEYRYQNSYPATEITVWTGLKVGFFQVLALVPGFSRSGATIGGGMLLGLTRSEATRFGFLLGVPVLLGAGGKKFIDLLSMNTPVAWAPIGLGAVVAFIVGLFAIHFMVTFLRKNTLWPFVWYRVILAGFVLYVLFFG